jgi:hypothetical protein
LNGIACRVSKRTVMSAKTFRVVYCERFRLPLDGFEEDLLWRCFHRRGLLIARLLWRLNRRYFEVELELIRSLADCASLEEVQAELDDFRYHHPPTGLLRDTLHVRVSGQRLLNKATRYLR